MLNDLRFACRQLAKAPAFAAVAVLSLGLGAVALLACWLPAIRAARVDPLTALRAE